MKNIIPSWLEQHNQLSTRQFLQLLLVTDLIFILLHALMLTSWVTQPLFSLESDHSYAECFQYLKELCIILLLVALIKKDNTLGYIAWVLIFTYVLLDDAIQIHETVGGMIAEQFNFPSIFNLRGKDLGELSVSAISGIILFSILAHAYWYGSTSFRKVTQHLLVLFVGVAFFGIVVDMLHMAIKINWKITWVLGVIEDGGEMIMMSLIAWYVFWLKKTHKSSGALYE